jgi:hypothetical protein
MSENEDVHFKGAVLKVRKLPKGWRVFVTLPDSHLREDDVPTTDDDAGRDAVIDAAKEIVLRKAGSRASS